MTATKTTTKTAKKPARKPAAKKTAVKKAAAKKAAPAAANTNTANVVMLPLNQLVASDLNPRKTFDDDQTAELAEGIAAQGVLQNLVARQLPKKRGKATHEIIAGGRRLRALNLLVKEKRLPADAPVPVRIVTADDQDARAMAILENLQREHVPPVEEGEAFKLLHEAGWKTATIAEKIGKTPRYVQGRIKIVERLGEVALKALTAGEINLAQAEAISDGAPEDQEEALECIIEGYHGWQREEDIRESMRQEMVPVAYAIFKVDPALILEGENGEPDLIRSKARFDILQNKAVGELESNLRETGWSAVQVVQWFYPADYVARKKDDGGHAIIHHNPNSGEVKVHHGLFSRTKSESEQNAAAVADGTAEAKPVKLFNQSQIDRAAEIKTAHLQNLVANAPETALRATIFGMLNGGPVRISARDYCAGPVKQKYSQVLSPLLKDSGADKDDAAELREISHWPSYSSPQLWDALQKRSIEQLIEILGVITGASMTTMTGSHPGNSDAANQIAEAAAKESALPINPPGTADDDYIAGARKPELMAIARAAGVESGLTDKSTGKVIKAAIDGKVPVDYVPVPCRFLTANDAAEAIKAEYPAFDKPDAGVAETPAIAAE